MLLEKRRSTENIENDEKTEKMEMAETAVNVENIVNDAEKRTASKQPDQQKTKRSDRQRKVGKMAPAVALTEPPVAQTELVVALTEPAAGWMGTRRPTAM